MDLSLSFFSKKFRRRRIQGGEVFDPVRDWFILLIAAAFVFALFLIVGAYLFFDVGDISYDSAPEAVPVETLNRAALQEALDVFKEKERSFEKIKQNPLRLVDPSR